MELSLGRPDGTYARSPAIAGRVGLRKTTLLRALELALASPVRALQLLFGRTFTEPARFPFADFDGGGWHEAAPGGPVEEAAACRPGA